MGSSGQVASGRISRDKGDWDRLRASGDGCRYLGPLSSLGLSLGPGTRWTTVDPLWRGSWSTDVLGQILCWVPRMARALRGLCRLVGDCCQPGVSMGRPAAWAASSRRLSYVANERRRSCRSRSPPEVTFTLRQPAGGAAGHGQDQGSVGPVIAGHGCRQRHAAAPVPGVVTRWPATGAGVPPRPVPGGAAWTWSSRV